MNPVKAFAAKEPVITWATVAAVFNALQLLALPGFPLWVHTVIVIAATVASVIAARSGTVAKANPDAVASAAKDLGLIEHVAKDL
jgi:membrane protein implicated in regulation of membrane protease activity